MAFKDFAEFSVGPLQLPYRGKVYTIPEVSVELGLRLASELADESSPLRQMNSAEAWPLLLGDAYEQMRKDDVPAAFVNRCLMTALADFQYGREAAEATWEAGIDPKALTAYYLKKAEGEAASTSTDEATTTP